MAHTNVTSTYYPTRA